MKPLLSANRVKTTHLVVSNSKESLSHSDRMHKIAARKLLQNNENNSKNDLFYSKYSEFLENNIKFTLGYVFFARSCTKTTTFHRNVANRANRGCIALTTPREVGIIRNFLDMTKNENTNILMVHFDSDAYTAMCKNIEKLVVVDERTTLTPDGIKKKLNAVFLCGDEEEEALSILAALDRVSEERLRRYPKSKGHIVYYSMPKSWAKDRKEKFISVLANSTKHIRLSFNILDENDDRRLAEAKLNAEQLERGNSAKQYITMFYSCKKKASVKVLSNEVKKAKINEINEILELLPQYCVKNYARSYNLYGTSESRHPRLLE